MMASAKRLVVVSRVELLRMALFSLWLQLLADRIHL
jgi:hypothetical protein